MPLSVSSEVDSPTVTGIREMGQVKLEKRQKAWLVEAVCACMAHIDLIESKDGNYEVRLKLRELKKAVFVNASDGSVAYTQDTQDYMDRADTGWDAILKLAAAKSTSTAFTSSTAAAASKSTLTDDKRDDIYQQLMSTQQEQEAEQTDDWIAAKATQKAEAKRLRQERREGREYVCPRMKSGQRCDGTQCTDGNGGVGKGGNAKAKAVKYHHPPVCRNPLHENVPKSEREGCVMWHFHSHPNANWGSKGNGSKSVKYNGKYNGNGNGSGNPRKTASGSNSNNNGKAAAEIARLKQAAAKQVVELAKANARAQVYRQVSGVSYSATASQAHPRAHPQAHPQAHQYLLAGSPASAGSGHLGGPPHQPPPPQGPGQGPGRGQGPGQGPGPPPDLASVLMLLERRMAAMETRFPAPFPQT
jgi:hypothetical protein